MELSTEDLIEKIVEKANLNVTEEKKLELIKIFLALIQENQTFQQAFGISTEAMEACYYQAYHLFKSGKYQEAIKIFEALKSLNARDPRYSFAIAASCHYMKDYAKAATNYTLCKESDPFNPIPSFHLYDCLIKLDQPLLAVDALAEVIVKSGDLEPYQSIKEKALLEKERLIHYLKDWYKVRENQINALN